MSDIYTWAELVQSGELDDYDSHHNQMDEEVVAEVGRCENGCSAPQIYRGVSKGNSYRAFFECTACGNVVEF